MENFKKLFSKTSYLVVPLALTVALGFSDQANQDIAVRMAPPYTEWQPSSADDELTQLKLLNDCKLRALDDDSRQLDLARIEYYARMLAPADAPALAPRNHVVKPCNITPADVAKANIERAGEHRRSYDNYTVGNLINDLHRYEKVTIALLSLLLFILVGFNVCQVYLKPLVLRATAPARSKNLEQEFLRLKMLHENGVLTDQEFAAKKETLRAKVMAES